MSKRDDFTTIIKTLKKALPSITDDQYKRLVRQGMHDYGLSQDEAERIIKKEVGLIIGKVVNHFQELGLTIDDLKNLSEDEIEKLVQAKYDLLYKQARISANPRNAEKQAALNAARDTLLDPQRRQEHIQLLERQKTSSNTEDGNSQKRSSTDVRAIFKFGKVAAILAILAFLLLLGLGLDNIIKNSKTQPHATEFQEGKPATVLRARRTGAGTTGSPAKPQIDPTTVVAVIETAKGTIEFEFLATEAPETSKNFIKNAQVMYYKGEKFNRAEELLVQAGSNLAAGDTLPIENGSQQMSRGVVALAKEEGASVSYVSEFFICRGDVILDSDYTIFGNVVSGMEVVDRITVGDAIMNITIREKE